MPFLKFLGSFLNSNQTSTESTSPITNDQDTFLVIRKVFFKVTQPYYKDMVANANINTLLKNDILTYNQKIKMYTERMLLHYYLNLGETIMTNSFKEYTKKLIKLILDQDERCNDHYDIYWLMVDMLAREVYERYVIELDSFVEPPSPFTRKRKREDGSLDRTGKEKISKH